MEASSFCRLEVSPPQTRKQGNYTEGNRWPKGLKARNESQKDLIDHFMASTRLVLYLLKATEFQTVLVTRVFTHPLGRVLHGACQEICQLKALIFLYLVLSMHIIFRAILNRLSGSLMFRTKNTCEYALLSTTIFPVTMSLSFFGLTTISKGIGRAFTFRSPAHKSTQTRSTAN